MNQETGIYHKRGVMSSQLKSHIPMTIKDKSNSHWTCFFKPISISHSLHKSAKKPRSKKKKIRWQHCLYLDFDPAGGLVIFGWQAGVWAGHRTM